ncbi:MAG: ATP-dependent helicase [Lachnospiraceae bacterium]|nr:ATP-dependent helicase [Lachnospiraceae bacterium]
MNRTEDQTEQLFRRLDPMQRAAASFYRGPCMVLAGPGSGKTTVITARTLFLIRKKKVPAENILVLTFTRQAAAEMRERFRKLEPAEVLFSTFHAFFYRVLTRHLSGERPRLIRERERRQLIRELLYRYAPALAEEAGIEERIFGWFSLNKAEKDGRKTEAGRGTVPPLYPFLQARYEEKKRERGLLDYDDILLRTLRLLQENAAVLAALRRRYRFLLVDEFQDVSPLQYRLLLLLAAPKNDLFAVGDDDQSIYAFRGADAGVMLNFRRDHPSARILLLNRNYRSGSAIVAHSLKLIGHNRARFQKALVSASADPGRAEVLSCSDEADEYRRIAAFLKDRPPDETAAVLVRTNEEAARAGRALKGEGIACVLAGKQEDFYSDPLFLPYYAYLSLAAGQERKRALLRVLNFPPRALPREELLLAGSLSGLIKRFRKRDRKQLYLSAKALEQAIATLKQLKDPAAMLRYVRGPLKTDAYLKETRTEREAEECLKKLDLLVRSAEPFRTAEAWFRHIAAERAAGEERGGEGTGAGAAAAAATSSAVPDAVPVLRILTLHAAKGLEFDTVFIPGLNEGNLPHLRSADGEDALEEERRLFYVGMTRAKKTLLMLYAEERHGKTRKVSRFIKETGAPRAAGSGASARLSLLPLRQRRI